MADIFVSYSSKDLDRAKQLALVLEELGWSVFWDQKIKTAAAWRKVIVKELKAAKCVVVLWSENSINSNYVIEEAENGKKRGILVPALIENVNPPFGFGEIQASDLSKWRGGKKNEKFVKLLNAIRSIAPPTGTSRPTGSKNDTGTKPARTPPPNGGVTVLEELIAAMQPYLRWLAPAAVVVLIAMVTFYYGSQLATRPHSEDEAWQRATKANTVTAYLDIITAFPNGRYVAAAATKVAELKRAIDEANAKEQARIEAEKRDEKLWEKARLENQVAAFQQYLAASPNGKFRDAAQAIITALTSIEADRKQQAEARQKKLDEDAWNTAKAQNTLESYKSYIASHAAGQFQDDAKARIATLEAELKRKRDQEAKAAARLAERERDNAAWAMASKEDTVASYRIYLAAHPGGSNQAEAEKRIAAFAREEELRREQEAKSAAEAAQRQRDDKAWAEARSQDSVAGYEGYLKDQANQAYRDLAQRNLALLEKERVAKEREEELRKAQAEARRRDSDAWEAARRDDSISAYEAYLRKQEKGVYRDLASQNIALLKKAEELRRKEQAEQRALAAKQQEDAEAWEKARSENSIAVYNAYLEQYPDGTYISQARQVIAALQSAEKQKLEQAKQRAEEAERKRQDSEAWAKAQAQDSIAGYKAYLASHAAGQHYGEALKKINEISARPDTWKIALYEGVDFFGGDMTSKFVQSARKLEDCWKICGKRRGCVAFTFNEPKRGKKKGSCLLKSCSAHVNIGEQKETCPPKVSLGVIVEAEGATSGYFFKARSGNATAVTYPVASLEPEVEYTGPNLSNDPHKLTSRSIPDQRCRAACLAEPKCKAFTYNKKTRQCWLKSEPGEGKEPVRWIVGGKKEDATKIAPLADVLDFGPVKK